MGDSSTSVVEPQDPTPGQAQRSESPSEEKAMDTSTGSTVAPTDSAQHANQEDVMSTDSSSTPTRSTSSNGASNGSTQLSGSSGDATSPADSSSNSGSNAASAPPKGGEKKKRAYPGKFLSSREKASAQKALAAAAGMTDPAIVAEVDTVHRCEQVVQEAQGTVLGCVAATRAARSKVAQSTLRLKPAVLAALWTLRCQPQGREFARSLEGKTESVTAQKILDTVPGSSAFRLSPDALKEIRDALPDVQAAERDLATAEQQEREAAAEYTQALVALEASVTVLGAALKTAKFRARIPVKPQPAKGELRLAKVASAHARKKVA